MRILLSLRFPVLPENKQFSYARLFNFNYLILSTNINREVYIILLSELWSTTLSPEIRVFDPPGFNPGDTIDSIEVDSNIIHAIQFDPTKCHNLFGELTNNLSDTRYEYLLTVPNNWFDPHSETSGWNYRSLHTHHNFSRNEHRYGWVYASKSTKQYDLDLYEDYDFHSMHCILHVKDCPRFEQVKRRYRIGPPNVLERDPTIYHSCGQIIHCRHPVYKLQYIPLTSCVIISCMTSFQLPLGGIYNCKTNEFCYRRFMDINSQCGLLLDGSWIDFTTNKCYPSRYEPVPVEGIWNIPLGLNKHNSQYWMEIKYNYFGLELSKIILLSADKIKTWTIPINESNLFRIEWPEIKEIFDQRITHPTYVYDKVFNDLFYCRFWRWYTSENLVSIVLWSSTKIIYLHPEETEVWIAPFCNIDCNYKFNRVRATDEGYVLATIESSFKLFIAREIKINRIHCIAPSNLHEQIKQNLYFLTHSANFKFNSLPIEIQEQIVRNTLTYSSE